jgi:hypothetical protein
MQDDGKTPPSMEDDASLDPTKITENQAEELDESYGDDDETVGKGAEDIPLPNQDGDADSDLDENESGDHNNA